MTSFLKKTQFKYIIPLKKMVKISFKSSLLCGLILCTFSVQAAWLSMVGGNTIDGSQLAVNNFGKVGTMGGFAHGIYRYTLTRSGQFTTTNLLFSVNSIAWSPNSNINVSNSVQNIGLSGIISYGVDCGFTENITMKIYNISGQEVLFNTFIIRNPLQLIPISNFKIFGSTASTPSIIKGCNSSSTNIIANAIKIYYTGTGTVQKYQVSIKQATSNGSYVIGGFQFIQNWVTAAVPSTIALNTMTGQTTGTPPTTWTYFLVTLETVSGPCSGGSGTHTALILLDPNMCAK